MASSLITKFSFFLLRRRYFVLFQRINIFIKLPLQEPSLSRHKASHSSWFMRNQHNHQCHATSGTRSHPETPHGHQRGAFGDIPAWSVLIPSTASPPTAQQDGQGCWDIPAKAVQLHKHPQHWEGRWLSTKHSAGTNLRNSVFGQWKVLQPIKVETPVRDIFETLATRWASEGRPGPHFFGVFPASRYFFPILCTSFLFQPCKMLQHFLAPGLASSLNYRNPTTWTHRAAT